METIEDQINIIVLASIFVVIILLVIIFLVVLYQKKQSQLLLEKNRERAKFQQQLLQSKIEIQEQAFNEISRELHDNLGQQLSLAKLQLGTLKGIADAQDREKIESTRDIISESIYQIRTISKTLLGEKVSSIGIAEAIKNETERINKLGVVHITVDAGFKNIFLDGQREVILFRIIQEALNNVLKHAAATTVAIHLDNQINSRKISIQDNGKGFILVGEGNNGIGLMNMKNRAQTIGAVLNIESALNKGTTVEIILEKPTEN